MSDMGSGGQISPTWTTMSNEAPTEETVRKHLSAHVHALTEELTTLELLMTKLDDLRAQLERAGRALAAFNETHPAAPVEPSIYDCGFCERTFGTKAGRTRHTRHAHPPVDMSATLLGDEL